MWRKRAGAGTVRAFNQGNAAVQKLLKVNWHDPRKRAFDRFGGCQRCSSKVNLLWANGIYNSQEQYTRYERFLEGPDYSCSLFGSFTKTRARFCQKSAQGLFFIINGTLYRGAHRAAGEIGFLPFGLNEAEEQSTILSENYLGMFEEAASAEGIVRLAHKYSLSPSLSAKQIFDAAEQANTQALTIIEQEGYHLALAIATITAVLDPELIVIGGGIGPRLELLRAPLERRLQQLTPLRPRIVLTKLSADSALLGAIATALETAHDLVFQHYFNGPS